MRLIRFISYDVNEGILRFWKRYLLLILLEVIICTMFNREMQYFLELYGTGWSPLEYGINEFWGRYAFHYNPDLAESFVVPFFWIMEYLVLGYCVGSYVGDDMQGFGIQLMVKSKQRFTWWCAKCVWCILVNIIYFGLLWCVNIGYAWIVTGDIRFTKHISVLLACYGNSVAGTEMTMLLIVTILIPFMVGIVQTLFQIICSVCYGSITAMAVLSSILVLSSYYSNLLLPHGYAMIIRHYQDKAYPDDKPLNYIFGIWYLSILIVLLIIVGYIIIRKKDILEQ